LLKWLRSLFGAKTANQSLMALQREVQGLRLELRERDELITNLKQDVERQRSGAGARVEESVQMQVEQLLAEAATPVAQLLTQAHLLEVDGRPVQAKDVLVVARRLVRILEDNGLELVGDVGESVSFDPNHHEPLSTASSPRRGERVVVRFVGVAYRGKLLRKAGVEKVEG
jgi:molecular chaperone GrpE (heat shock protein)